MNNLREIIIFKKLLNKITKKYKLFETNAELSEAIRNYNNNDIIQKYGNISNWNVSNITDMSYIFYESKFNEDISEWDVSNVIYMSNMFREGEFNGDISNWNVSNVIDMNYMFINSKFNGDISNWDVSNVIDMSNIFYDCTILEEYKPKKKYSKEQC